MSAGEITILLIVGIVVVGPQKLPGMMRTAGQWVTRLRRMSSDLRSQSGIDRISLRRRNFIRPDQMPYKNPMAQVYDDGKFEHVMDQALAMADWDGFAARAAASRSSGKWRGLGSSLRSS